MTTILRTPAATGTTLSRTSARFGLAFSVGQVGVMVAMATLVLPRGGRLGMDPTEWGQRVLDAEQWFRLGNYVFLLAGMLLLGFLGVVHERLRRVDPSGVLSTVAVGAGVVVSFVWPYAAILHDVAIEAAGTGADPRMLAGWDSVAPYSLAFSAVPRIFFVGALVLGLRRAGTAPRLQRVGVALLPLFLVGSATLVLGAAFPVLALSTLAYEIWVGALAWHWLRHD
ncbi:hypothetical protein [Nocardioides marmoribigeumensis]|uniref:DUF4386 family protein n=1 Tax=Nocardioides marmoribigeumensis TaxID=433649 RepID=A0ABU2BVF7_9ACTN|nr:hypothetical protein [Nocardioides marmoribigeumensis]MDR7362626.1 hypothetical protein [Nocardioides marmoribigeumensis]